MSSARCAAACILGGIGLTSAFTGEGLAVASQLTERYDLIYEYTRYAFLANSTALRSVLVSLLSVRSARCSMPVMTCSRHADTICQVPEAPVSGTRYVLSGLATGCIV